MSSKWLKTLLMLIAAVCITACTHKEAPTPAQQTTPDAANVGDASAQQAKNTMDMDMDMAGHGHGAHHDHAMHMSGQSAQAFLQALASAPERLKTPAALVGQSLPPIKLTRSDGPVSKLQVHDNKPTVVAMWSTWCRACLGEVKQLSQWAKHQDDVNVLLVNIDASHPDLAKVMSAAHEMGIKDPVWMTSPKLAARLGVRMCPTTFIANGEGVVTAAHEGFGGGAAMEAWLSKNLKVL